MAKRENGSGSIVRRKYAHSTKYVAYAPATYDTDDQNRVITIRAKIGAFPSAKEARAALDLYLQHPSPKYTYTLRQLYEEWCTTPAFMDLGKSTQTNWTTSWTKIAQCPSPALADILVRDISVGLIRELLDYYAHDEYGPDGTVARQSLSKSYITKIKALLTQLCAYAMEYHIIDRNYASLAKLPKMEAGKRRAMTDLEFAKLKANWQTARGGDACLVLCYTGLRVSELCQLTRFSYDPTEKVLRGGLKTDAGRDRVVPVHPNIQPIIDAWYTRSTGPLYPRPDGKPYNKDTFNIGVWRPCMESLGLPADLTPHSARHTFGTQMAKAGARPEDIQKIMGHTEYSMTADTYIDQDNSTLTAAVRMMA